MLLNTNTYTSLAPGPAYYGYIKAVAQMPAEGANLKANGNLNLAFSSLLSTTTYITLYVVIKGSNGGYVTSSALTSSVVWYDQLISFNSLNLPSDVSYTVDDVITNASSIELVIRYYQYTQNATQTFGIYLDDISLDNTI